MAIRTELELGVRGFNANLDAATRKVRDSARQMRSDTRGIGADFAGGVANYGSQALAMMGLGGGAVGLGAAIKGALTRADDIADLTLKLNDSAEALQRVDYVAQLTASMGVDQVADAMMRLERTLGDIDNPEAAQALQNLGISVEELQSMTLDEKLIALSAAFQKARDDGTGMYDLQILLGRSAGELVPLLEQGEDALKAMFAQAPAMAEETVLRMAEINDQIDGMIMRSKTFFAESVGAISGIDLFLSQVGAGILQGRGLDDAIETALLMQADRDVAAAQTKRERSDQRAASARGNEAQRKALADAAAKTEQEKRLSLMDKAEAELATERARAAEKAASDAEREARELNTLRSETEQGRFDLMDPAGQAAYLRNQLAASLGIPAGSTDQIEASLQSMRDLADDLQAEGDVSGEAEVRQKLIKAQEQYGRLRGLAKGMDGAEAAGELGSVARLFNQVMGRDPQQQAVEELRQSKRVLEDQRDKLDGILAKMDEPAPTSVFAGPGWNGR